MGDYSGLVTAMNSDPLVRLALSAFIPAQDVQRAYKNALIGHSEFIDELIVLGLDYEQRIYAAFAANANLGFMTDLDPENLVIGASIQAASLRRLPFANYRQGFAESLFLVAPATSQLRHLLSQPLDADRFPRLRIVTPSELSKAVEIHFRDQRVKEAVHAYATQHPEHSSRVTLHGLQGWYLGLFFGAGPAVLILFPNATVFVLHIFAWSFFFSCVVLRLLAAMVFGRENEPTESEFRNSVHPQYAVLVALYNEADVVGQLVASLQKLKWPQGRIKFYLICEQDDRETQNALEAEALPANFQIVLVPDYGPRTKPKALMYALPLVEAEYLVLYDAEDRPHPNQLKEAHEKFQTCGLKTACVQAPLEITNLKHSMLTSLFAFEYDALFRGLLPFLSHYNLFIPLGGTSNHFRLDVLRKVGGWDPFNVTEDADLGLRLHRYGYLTKTISLPTLEDAPEELSVWIKQRTRWFKGHIQTWMVSLRSPGKLISEIGWPSFLISQVMLGGIIISALAHPILLASVITMTALYALGISSLSISSPLAFLDFINVILGYFAFMVLGYVATKRSEKAGIWKRLILIPPYWILLSVAAWRATIQIIHAPHQWEKTPHKPTRGAS